MIRKLILRPLLSTFMLIAICHTGKAQLDISQFVGQWQINDKPSFEEWAMITDDSLSGKGYKLVQTEQVISEYLSVFRDGADYYYSARVPTQNNGKAILFKWIHTEDSCEIFENPDHDFPQRIKYCFLNDASIKVFVSSLDGRGFDLMLSKHN